MGIHIYVPRKCVPIIMGAIITNLLVWGINSPMLSIIVAYIFWIGGVLFSISRIRGRFTLLSFDIGFFAFILGGFTISYLKTGDFRFFSNSYFTSSNAANVHTCLCVAICMIWVNSCYYAFCNNFSDNPYDLLQTRNAGWGRAPLKATDFVKQILVGILIVSYLCRIVQAVEEFILVRSVSYYDSVSYLSTLPSIIIHIGSLYFVTLFMFLATFPSQKVTMRCIISLLILEGITLASGARGEPISTVLVIIFYIFLRNRAGIEDIQISKKFIIIGLLLLPIVMYSLQALSYTRNKAEYHANFSEGVTDFIETQGGSAKIIANSYDLDEKINDMVNKRTFVLGEIRYYFKSNVFTRMLTGKSVTLRTVEDAFSGDNFLRSYGYAYAPPTYLKNVGAGSTYIAEVYYDGRYILLVLANIFIALMLYRIDRNSSSNFISSAILLNIFRYMPLLPRGMMLDWLTNTFALQNIAYFLLIYALCKNKNKE